MTPDEMIRALERVSNLAEVASKDCAAEVKRVLDTNVRSGVAPDGQALKRRKKDGQRPLQHAAGSITVAAVGATLILTVRGIEARHSLGLIKGKTKRPLIPTQEKLPQNIHDAIEGALNKHFERLTSGGAQ